MNSARFGGPKGFTLIEMVVVVAIIALLAGVITPLVFNMLDEGNEAATRQEMSHLRDALMRYYNDVNAWPPTWVSDGATYYSGLLMLAVTQTKYGPLLPCDGSGKVYQGAQPVEKFMPSGGGSYTDEQGMTQYRVGGAGWNGPYIASSEGEKGFLYDAWDNEYAYVSYPDYYVVSQDVAADNPAMRMDQTQFIAVPVEPARVFIASRGADGLHTDVAPSPNPGMKSEYELYPENRDDIVIVVAGTGYALSYWKPLAATMPYH